MTEIDHATGRPTNTTVAHIMYALHAVAPFTLWSLALLAVIIGAFTRDSVRGTYVETHFAWLLSTFIWGIVWLVVATVIFFLTIIGIWLVWIPWGLLTIWYLYRVVRGWLRLNDARPAPI